ncbi:hypothetical protein [Tetragenococcus halophilus]|uniref:Uncharacterized protein n=1 Tax=Tetragenococcus halophilus (strain DSM 20338 / JCM 20259 / NCIMB 9735 / NBRC 12172) TaxID=945021 RepID=A0AAN1SFN6_TETHN|nr:hypothetical protein [Tetragenococcus halophilus]BAK94163.1 hypothetical protein TEH_08360 [Tetragenococcus halophilus NBRC 12172]GBD70789.1 putative uncharacterized protein [Tetragenococcus halophilus subsp. halophilus]
MFNYDKAMADETSGVFTNIHPINQQEIEEPLTDWTDEEIQDEQRVFVVELEELKLPECKMQSMEFLATDDSLIDLFNEKLPKYEFKDMEITTGKELV